MNKDLSRYPLAIYLLLVSALLFAPGCQPDSQQRETCKTRLDQLIRASTDHPYAEDFLGQIHRFSGGGGFYDPECPDSLRSYLLTMREVSRTPFETIFYNQDRPSTSGALEFLGDSNRYVFERQPFGDIGPSKVATVSVNGGTAQSLGDSCAYWINRVDAESACFFVIDVGGDSLFAMIGLSIDRPGLMASMKIHVLMRPDFTCARSYLSMYDDVGFIGDIDRDGRVDHVEFDFGDRFFHGGGRSEPGWMIYRVIEENEQGGWEEVLKSTCF